MSFESYANQRSHLLQQVRPISPCVVPPLVAGGSQSSGPRSTFPLHSPPLVLPSPRPLPSPPDAIPPRLSGHPQCQRGQPAHEPDSLRREPPKLRVSAGRGGEVEEGAMNMRPPPADTSFPAPHCTALQRGWPPHTHCCFEDPPPHCLPCRPPSLPPPAPAPSQAQCLRPGGHFQRHGVEGAPVPHGGVGQAAGGHGEHDAGVCGLGENVTGQHSAGTGFRY